MSPQSSKVLVLVLALVLVLVVVLVLLLALVLVVVIVVIPSDVTPVVEGGYLKHGEHRDGAGK